MRSIKDDAETNLEQNNLIVDKFQNVVKTTLLLALAGIPLIIVPLGGKFDHFYFPKVVGMFVLVFSFLIMLILNIRKIGKFVDRDWINKTLLIYFCLLLSSLFFTNNLNNAIYGSPGRVEGLITISMYMMLFLIGRYFSKLNDKLFIAVMVTAVIISIYGIMQYFGFDIFPRDDFRVNWTSSAFSTMGNPNFLGSYLVLMIPVSIYFYIIKKNNVGILCYAILLFCLLATRTRGSWLGAIVSIICFIVLHFIFYKHSKDEMKRYIFLIIISVIIISIFNFLSDGALLSRFITISLDAKEFLGSGEKSDYAGSHRGFIWKRVIELIKMRPLTGYGIENLGETFEKYYSQDMIEFWGEIRNVDRTHNEYLHIAVTTGLPSLIAYSSFVGLILKSGLKKINNNKFALMLCSSVVGYLAAAFFNISVVSVAYIYWIFLGFISCNELKL